MKFIITVSIGFMLLMSMGSCSSSNAGNLETENIGVMSVEIKEDDGVYRLHRNGKPYVVKGAGLEFGSTEKFAEHGGNSIRNWSTNNAQTTLDEALKNDVTVSLCLSLGHERHGFDYNDEAAVKAQFEKMKKEVIKFKDHPALLTWIIGNELNHKYSNPKVYDAVNDISQMIHEVDSLHPTTTAVAGLDQELVDVLKERATDIDFLSIQLYGGIIDLPKYISETGWTKPFMVTEWGATGWWEVAVTPWGAPIEQNSTEKANAYLTRYENAIRPMGDQCLGSYVFLWGQKQERTPTWFGMFLESGEETQSVDAMHYVWNKKMPKNTSPELVNLTLNKQVAYDNVRLKIGETYDAVAVVLDRNNDKLSFFWEVKLETTDLKTGGDKEEVPPTVEGLIEEPFTEHVQVRMPEKSGAYRLFFYAFDNQGHAAHANIPFFVD